MTERTIHAAKGDGPIILEITGAYGAHADAPAPGTEFQAMKDQPVGHTDDDGVEHFNDRIVTPFGLLGNLKSHIAESGEVVIDQAPGVVLVSRSPLEEWPERQRVGVTIDTNVFGFRTFELKARNGVVRYMLCDDDIRFSDEDEVRSNLQVARLLVSQWTPEGPPPPRTKTVTTTKMVKQP